MAGSLKLQKGARWSPIPAHMAKPVRVGVPRPTTVGPRRKAGRRDLPMKGPPAFKERRRAGSSFGHLEKLKKLLDCLGQERKEGARENHRYERSDQTPHQPWVQQNAPYRKHPLRESVRQKGP